MFVPWSVILIISPLLLFGLGMAVMILVIASVAIVNFLFPRRVYDAR